MNVLTAHHSQRVKAVFVRYEPATQKGVASFFLLLLADRSSSVPCAARDEDLPIAAVIAAAATIATAFAAAMDRSRRQRVE